MLKAIHAQESREAADQKFQAIVDDLRARKMGNAADLVKEAVHETLTYLPDSHWQKIRTNNPLERIMKQSRRNRMNDRRSRTLYSITQSVRPTDCKGIATPATET